MGEIDTGSTPTNVTAAVSPADQSATISATPAAPVGSAEGYTLFDTALGRCGIGWNERGIAAVQLPGPSDARLAAHVRRKIGRAHV